MKKTMVAAALGLCLLVAAFAQTPAKDEIKSLAAKRFENYRYDPGSPLVERIAPAPRFLLEYLRNMDGTEAYEPYTPKPEELELFEQVFLRQREFHDVTFPLSVLSYHYYSFHKDERNQEEKEESSVEMCVTGATR